MSSFPKVSVPVDPDYNAISSFQTKIGSEAFPKVSVYQILTCWSSVDGVEPQTHNLSASSGPKTWIIQCVSSFSLLLAGWSVKPDQPACISTTYRPPIIPQWKADCKNRRDSSVIMSEQQQTVDSSLSCRIQRCFSPKTHMAAISVAVRTGTFPSPPPHSLYSCFGMHHHRIIWELIKEEGQQSKAPITWC